VPERARKFKRETFHPKRGEGAMLELVAPPRRRACQELEKRPRFYIKDQNGGWYLQRKRWNREGCCLSLTWTHNRAEARKFTKEVDAALLKNRIAIDYAEEGKDLILVTTID
jgi:hypothetical protein